MILKHRISHKTKLTTKETTTNVQRLSTFQNSCELKINNNRWAREDQQEIFLTSHSDTGPRD